MTTSEYKAAVELAIELHKKTLYNHGPEDRLQVKITDELAVAAILEATKEYVETLVGEDEDITKEVGNLRFGTLANNELRAEIRTKLKDLEE